MERSKLTDSALTIMLIFLMAGSLIITISVFAETAVVHEVPHSPYYPRSNEDWWLYQFEGDGYQSELEGHPPYSNTNCGPACTAMVINYLKGKDVTTKCEPNRINPNYPIYCYARWLYCQANGHPEGFYNSDWSIPGATTSQIQYALSVEGIKSHTLTGYECKNDGTGIKNIQNAIDEGKICICLVAPMYYRKDVTKYFSHWTTVYGYDDKYIYLNDPGYRTGKGFKAEKKDFADAIWLVKELSTIIVVDTTVTTNVDAILVIDRSGSMGEIMGDKTKMEGAKEAAISAVNTLFKGDKVGVISFSSTATINVHLTSDFDYAKKEIKKIIEGGWTSFGAGLSLALQEFEANGRKDSAWAILFLSDGWHNTAPAPEPYVKECENLGIPIYTIGLGNTPADVNEDLLRWMAEETGGKYLFAPSLHELENIFIRFSLEATGYKISAEFTGIVSEGQTVIAGTFDVEPNTDRIRITLNWPGSDLDLVIIRPDGTQVNFLIDPDVIYSGSVAKPEWAILLAPQTGTWTVKVYGKEITSPEEQFIVWISTYEAPPLPKIDETPPTTTLTIGEPKYVSNITYVTPETPFILNATDNINGTGVFQTAYRIYNETYSSDWIIYIAPFYLTNIRDGTYHIDYNSTDNAGNTEPTNTITVVLFSWNHIFTDSYERNTTLKVNLEHRFFQFITPDRDYEIKNATYMRLRGRTIIIKHYDEELRLITMALDTKLDFCVAVAWDIDVHTRYFLIDRASIEDQLNSPIFLKSQ